MWEQGNIGQFWKGTREKGPPPLGDRQQVALACIHHREGYTI